jgi:hypothetical protein
MMLTDEHSRVASSTNAFGRRERMLAGHASASQRVGLLASFRAASITCIDSAASATAANAAGSVDGEDERVISMAQHDA